MSIKKYDKEADYSYTLGAFPTFELIKRRPSSVQKIIFHEKLVFNEEISALRQCALAQGIAFEQNSRLVEKLSVKENTFIVGLFEKYECRLDSKENHVCLVNPSDMGNLGTIMRTMLGFGVKNLALIGEHADYFNPKAVRASMGSVFALNIRCYDTFDKYYAETGERGCYPFMLVPDATPLSSLDRIQHPFTMIMGNEGSGLPEEFAHVGTPVVIAHSRDIDSLNLPIATAIGLYHFTK